ncbi:MAG: hypothetical protein WCA30_11865 [Dermatophilaceae bacterium]
MRRARVVAVSGTSGLVAFQLALAAGAPWGRLAWGGRHERVLPTELRAASMASALVWAGALVAAATASHSPAVTRARTAYAILAGVGTVMNAVSPSRPERLLWTPVAGALAGSLWRLSRERGDVSGSL